MYIFDLDSTLSDSKHRVHYIQAKPKDWNKFCEESINDNPIWETMQLYQILADDHWHVVVVTGRKEKYREMTMQWFQDNGMKLLDEDLYMRKNDDNREDWVIKEEILNKLKKQEIIHGVFEDRKQCVEMYRRNGVMCFQVAEGNY